MTDHIEKLENRVKELEEVLDDIREAVSFCHDSGQGGTGSPESALNAVREATQFFNPYMHR